MTRAELRAEERRWRRGDVLTAVAAILLGAAFAWIMLSIQGLNHELKNSNRARDLLAQQVEDLGETPVAGPPGSRGEPGDSVTGPPGPSGPPGPQGERGPVGLRGPVGPSGSPGANGINGSDGQTGVPGSPGSDGANGSAGPAGPAGPPGPQGDPGPAGPQGEQGPAGEDGADGQTCPDGYSLQAPSYDPDALVCRRDGAEPPPSEESLNLSAVALDPQRKQYA